MKKFDPNNFVINHVFDKIDKKLKNHKKVDGIVVAEEYHIRCDGPIDVEINV